MAISVTDLWRPVLGRVSLRKTCSGWRRPKSTRETQSRAKSISFLLYSWFWFSASSLSKILRACLLKKLLEGKLKEIKIEDLTPTLAEIQSLHQLRTQVTHKHPQMKVRIKTKEVMNLLSLQEQLRTLHLLTRMPEPRRNLHQRQLQLITQRHHRKLSQQLNLARAHHHPQTQRPQLLHPVEVTVLRATEI